MAAAPIEAATPDGLAPSLVPPGLGVMRQRWARLLFLHWEVEPGRLAALLPPGLVPDTHVGRAFVGLVPFTMTGVRPTFLPAVRGLSSFHEVNVRTYVRGPDGTHGVWFFSLDAANAVAVKIARWTFRLPYHFARMSMSPPDGAAEPARVSYESARLWPGPLPAGCRLRYEPTGTPSPAAPGTLDHFLVERYTLFAESRGRLFSGRVHHPPYPLQLARLLDLEENLLAAAGIDRPDDVPLVHYAREVRVRVFPLRPVNPAA